MTASRRLLLSSITLFVVYGNVATIWNRLPDDYVEAPFDLPIPKNYADVFMMFGVFGGYKKTNVDFVILGRRENWTADSGRPKWSPVDVSEYLPRHPGYRHTFVRVFIHYRHFRKSGEREAWIVLARKLRERYNRDHPDDPLAALAIGQEQWPVSTEGWDGGRTRDKVTQIKVFSEDDVADR